MKYRPNNDGITNGGGGGFCHPNGNGVSDCRDGTCYECCKGRKS